jgi:glycosyltransferase involved in cell wall biosynthesis
VHKISRKTLLYLANEDWAFIQHRLPMARAARAAGFDVHVATNISDHADAIRAEGFTLHPIALRRGSRSPITSLASVKAIRTIEQRIRPQLLHHSGLQCCVLGGFAALGLSIPQINAMTGLGYTFTGKSTRAQMLRFIVSAGLRFLLNRKNSTALVQNPDDQRTLENVGIDPARIALIPGSGVDTDVLTPLPEPDGPITVGFAGRLLTDKGIRALVAAHEILQTRGLDTRLLIAGEPDPANPASVSLQEAQRWNARPGITWLGHVDDITSLWRSSHIAALPSHREGLPKSLIEAAACGRPLIAANAPGSREIVIQNRTGLLVPLEDPEALADAISTLAASQDLRARYGTGARQLVVEKMSAKAIGTAVVALYKEQLQRAR